MIPFSAKGRLCGFLSFPARNKGCRFPPVGQNHAVTKANDKEEKEDDVVCG
ncbi:hypothetical protein PthstB1num2_30110 [Parageobacillus thermoglucosidasius]|nr:hypothetical protein PthstB1num2_30110 [Parageobacillus thermoglucosidasius]